MNILLIDHMMCVDIIILKTKITKFEKVHFLFYYLQFICLSYENQAYFGVTSFFAVSYAI